MSTSNAVHLDRHLRPSVGWVCLVFGLYSGLFAGCETSVSPESAPGTEASPETEGAVNSSPSEDSRLEVPRTLEDSLAENCDPGNTETHKTWHGGIERVLHEKCMVCHGDEPLYGAPFSLSTYERMLEPSSNISGEFTYESVRRSILDGSMPPAGQPMMTDLEVEEFLDWVKNCLPEGDVSEAEELSEVVKPQVPPAPEGLTVIQLSANEHEVPVGQDQYMCFPYVLDLEGPKSIARIDFQLDEAAVIHHMVLYADVEKVTDDEPFPCLQVPVEHSAFMFEWGPGGYPAHFPDDAGISVENGSKVILQVHYSNTQGLENLKDSSGLTLYLDEPRENEVAMFASGPLAYTVPPFSEVDVESTCYFDEPVNILSSTPHMHETGREFLTEVIRADGSIETVVEIDQWNFFEQPMYSTPLVLNPGDALRTRCTLENTTAMTLNSGETTEDQMCFNFMYHTPPIGALFCDVGSTYEVPPLLEDELGDCGEEVVLSESIITFDNMYGTNPPYFKGAEELPEGDWVLTKADLFLPHFHDRRFELIKFEESVGHGQFSLKIEPGKVSFHLNMSFLMIVVSGGVAEKQLKAAVEFVPYFDQELNGIRPLYFLCKANATQESGHIKYMRLQPEGDKLIGYIQVSREDEQESVMLYAEFERP